MVIRTSADSEKDYVGIDDVVHGLIKITLEGKQNVYNLASGINVSNRQLTQKISELTGCRIAFDPMGTRQSFPTIRIDRMRSEFGFQPVFVLDDLERLVGSYKADFEKQRSAE